LSLRDDSRIGFGIIEVLFGIVLLSVCLLPLLHHLTATGPLIREAAIKEAASTINTSYLETYRSQPYQRLKLLTGLSELTIPAALRAQLSTRLSIVEIIPDRLLSITVTTSFADSSVTPQSLATMIANHHPFSGVMK
jgi:Tfp pilus assembly protein PilV